MPVLLPRQQTEAQLTALKKFLDQGRLKMYEPCDCGHQTRHNNGGNYHLIEEVAADSGKWWSRATSTSEYDDWTEWMEHSLSEALELIARRASEGWSCA